MTCYPRAVTPDAAAAAVRPRGGAGAATTPQGASSPGPDVPAGAPRAGRWLVVLGVGLLALNLRPAATAVSPVLGRVSADIGLGGTAAGLLGTAPTLAFALFGALTPLVVRRVGLERTAWLAMVLAAAGQLLRAAAPGTVTFLVLSFLALGGMGMGNVVLPPLVKRWFPDRVAAMTAAYVLLLALGTSLAPLAAVPVADGLGWRASVATWGLLALVAAVPWVVAGRRDTRRRRSVQRHPARGRPAPTDRYGAREMLRSPVAWGLATFLGMTSLNTYAMFAWLPSLLIDAGLPEQHAGLHLALFAAVGMPTSLLVPWAASRMRNPFPLVLGFLAAYLAGYTGLLLVPATATAVWVVLAGLGPAAFPLALTLVALRSRTTAGAVALSGFAQGVGYLVAGAGPLLVGALREATGGWGASFAVLFATLAVQVAGGAVACRPRCVEDDADRPRAATTLTR
jgi:MFS transporter, CP family, cyanate transporter